MKKGGKLFCNCCGRELKMEREQLVEDFFHLQKSWGYFSERDGTVQIADICENCMQQWIQGFQIQPDTAERTEIFEC